MVTAWAYPWTLYGEGLDAAFDTLEATGIDGVTVAAQYHSVRAFQPRVPDALFEAYPGGCYFDPDPDRFAGSEIDPLRNEIDGPADPLREIASTPRDVSINAWFVCLHNTRLATANPAYRLQGAFGTPQDHALCPSNPEVIDYCGRVAGALAERGVSEIQLESIGFPGLFHGHGSSFGHDKRQTVTTGAEEWLLSQCFCDACRRRAESSALAFEDAGETVRSLLEPALRGPTPGTESVASLLQNHPILRELVAFRAGIVEELVERIATSARAENPSVDVSTYIGLDEATGTGRSSGVDPDRLAAHLDRVMVICYVSDPDEVRRRVRSQRETHGLAVDVGLTLDPSIVASAEEFEQLFAAGRAAADGIVSVYNYSMLAEDHLEWIANAAASSP